MVGDQWANFVTGGLQASAGEVTVENSTVNDAGSAPAFWVYSSSLDFDHLTGNSATGGSVPGFFVAGTVSTSSDWQDQPAPWVIGVLCSGTGLTIASGVTVTVGAGTVIKGADTNYTSCGGGTEPALTVEGTLDAQGTSVNPALFTSVNDSTVGGDTGTGTPAAGDWGGIELSGAGSVDLAYTDLEYAIQGLFGSTTGSLSMVGDQWANFVTGGLQASAGEVTVENSTVNDAGSAPAFWVYSSSLDFDHLTGNSRTGGSVPGFFVAGTVSTSSDWQDQPAPWVIGVLCSGTGLTMHVGSHRYRRSGHGHQRGRYQLHQLRWGDRTSADRRGHPRCPGHLGEPGPVHLGERQHRGRRHRHGHPCGRGLGWDRDWGLTKRQHSSITLCLSTHRLPLPSIFSMTSQ